MRQIEQRTTGKGNDGAGLARVLGHDVVVGHGANAARHVDDAHGRLERARLLQAFGSQPAGQVEAAAGLGRGNALGPTRLVAGRMGGVANEQGAQASQGGSSRAEFRQGMHRCGLRDRCWHVVRTWMAMERSRRSQANG
ncbi:Uncharacterised protein [Bordetella pertussis]|nr:Uncharacterised protein [Bordetella pertussis]